VLELADIEAAINVGWNCSDFGAELLFHMSQRMSVVVCNQIHSQTQVPETTGTSDTMKVGLAVLGKVEIDNYIDGLDIDTSSEKV